MKSNTPFFNSAKWIWPNSSMYLLNCYAGFRYDFKISEIPDEAPLFLTADQSYRLHVNGKYVCRGPVRGSQDAWSFDTLDISSFLKTGHNFIAVEAYNPGISTFSYTHRDRAGFICAAKWSNGTEFYSCRESWAFFRLHAYSSQTARLSIQMAFQEDLDLQLDDRLWLSEEHYTAPAQEKWVRPEELAFGALPWTGVVSRPLPMLDEHCRAPEQAVLDGWGKTSSMLKRGGNISWDFAEKELPSIQWKKASGFIKEGIFLSGIIPAENPGYFYAVTFDLGKDWLTGTPILEVENAEAGTIVELHYYHYLPDGQAELQPEPGIGSMVALAARLHLRKGNYRHEFFQIMGVRHVTLVVRRNPHPLKLKLSWRTALYPMKISGDFTSSNQNLNEIYRISCHTQQVCSMDVFVDTPWREQSQWWGDARVQGKNFFWLTGDTKLLKYGIQSIAAQQGAPDGLIFANAPTTQSGNILPDFCLTWIATIYDLYFQTGQTDFVEEQMPRIRNILNYFEQQRGRNGMIGYDERFWLFEDWGDLPKKPYPAFLNLLHCYVMELYRKLLCVCGMDDSDVRKKIIWERSAIKRAFFNPRQKLIMPILDEEGRQTGIPSVHDQVWALLLNLVPEAHDSMLKNRILPCLAGTLLEGAQPGAFWSTYLLDAAMQLGMQKEALGYIQRKWLPMIPAGTTWEVFDRGAYTGWSYSHAWSAHPVTHLPELLCGIIQMEPAWRKVRICPCFPNGETFASATIPTVHGLLHAEWKKQDMCLQYFLELPERTEAEIIICGHQWKHIRGKWSTALDQVLC